MRIGDIQGARKYKNIEEIFARQGNSQKDSTHKSDASNDAAVNKLSDDKLLARYEKVASRYEKLRQKVEERGLAPSTSAPGASPQQSGSSTGTTSSTSNT